MYVCTSLGARLVGFRFPCPFCFFCAVFGYRFVGCALGLSGRSEYVVLVLGVQVLWLPRI